MSFIIERKRKPAFSFPNYIASYFFPKLGLISFTGFLFIDNERYFLLGTRDDITKAKERVLSHVRNNPQFITDHLNKFNKEKKIFLRYVRNSTPNGSLQSIYKKIVKYYELYERLNRWVTPLMFFASEPLYHYLSQYIKEPVLFSPRYLSHTAEYKMDLDRKIEKVASFMARKWGWIQYDYYGPFLGKRYFQEKLGYSGVKKRHQELLLQQKSLIKHYSSHLQRMLHDYHVISYLQDKRKAICTISHTYLNQLYKRISEEKGMEFEHLRVMTLKELKEIIKGASYNPKKYDLRKQEGLILYKGTIEGYEGDHPLVQEFKSRVTFQKGLNGTMASKGYAKGPARICFSVKDCKKVKKGDILVAQMTYPSFFEAMQRAAGFITDEGGMTSHAAIIAREMNKPCVIGTNNATSEIKDGQEVVINNGHIEVK